MKRIFLFMILWMALAACTAPQVRTPEPVGMDTPQVNMPNPASVYCTQKGNKLEIRTATDGGQSGVCIFPDGSTCDEWAYYRAECGPAAGTSPTPAVTAEPTADGSGDGRVERAGSTSVADASGGYMPPGTSEEITDWWGVIKSTQPGAQYDDYFERQDLGQQFIYFGIDSLDPAIQVQIKELRDNGKVVHLYGTLFSNVPDYNGSQIRVDRIEPE